MKHWYALRSKPKKEMAVAALLSRSNVDVYVPMGPVLKPWRREPVSAPFFSGYLFGRLDASAGEVQMARYTPGIVDVVGYGGEPWPVPEELIEAIRERLERLQARKGAADLRPGDQVAISSGPFRGVEGVFDSHLSSNGRAKVLVKLLRRLCPVDVNLGQLRLVKKAAG